MNLHHLELFYYVARHGGISRALRHIPYGIQQPAVSSQILLLEQDLGAKLFDRKPFRLTAEGQELYEFAQPFFENADAVAARLRNRQAPRLRIAASELVLRNYLPTVIDRMRHRHPGLRFRLRNGFQKQLETWLQEGEIDLAITPLESKPRAGLQWLPIVEVAPVLLVPKESALRTAAQLWARERIEDSLICLPSEEALTVAFRKGLRELKIEWPTSIEASSTEVVIQYVADGYGLGIGLSLPDLIGDPRVRAIALPGFDSVAIAALWRSPASPLLDELQKEIRQRVRELWPDRAGRGF